MSASEHAEPPPQPSPAHIHIVVAPLTHHRILESDLLEPEALLAQTRESVELAQLLDDEDATTAEETEDGESGGEERQGTWAHDDESKRFTWDMRSEEEDDKLEEEDLEDDEETRSGLREVGERLRGEFEAALARIDLAAMVDADQVHVAHWLEVERMRREAMEATRTEARAHLQQRAAPTTTSTAAQRLPAAASEL